MPFFSNKFKLGLDIGSNFLKLCQPRRGNRPFVVRVSTPPGAVSNGVLQQPEAVKDVLRQILRQHRLYQRKVVLTLPATTMVLRHIQIPMLRERETADAVEWEARRVLPFPLEDAQVDWLRQGTVVSDDGEMQDILLVAVRNSLVERYCNAVHGLNLRLVALDIAPLALGRWLLKGVKGSSLIIDMGAEATQMHFFADTKLVFSRSMNIGGTQATKAIQTAEECEEEEAEVKKLRGEYREHWLDTWYAELGRELQRSLEYYRSNFGPEYSGNFDRVMLTGGASLTRGIESLIKEVTGVEPGFAEFSGRMRSPRHDKVMFNVALGAGLWEG